MGHTLAIELSPVSSILFLNLQTLTDFLFIIAPLLDFWLKGKEALNFIFFLKSIQSYMVFGSFCSP